MKCRRGGGAALRELHRQVFPGLCGRKGNRRAVWRQLVRVYEDESHVVAGELADGTALQLEEHRRFLTGLRPHVGRSKDEMASVGHKRRPLRVVEQASSLSRIDVDDLEALVGR